MIKKDCKEKNKQKLTRIGQQPLVNNHCDKVYMLSRQQPVTCRV